MAMAKSAATDRVPLGTSQAAAQRNRAGVRGPSILTVVALNRDLRKFDFQFCDARRRETEIQYAPLCFNADFYGGYGILLLIRVVAMNIFTAQNSSSR